MIPTAPVTGMVEQAVKSSYDTYGAFDPTPAILWTCTISSLGRYVSETELADALRWSITGVLSFMRINIEERRKNCPGRTRSRAIGALMDILLAELAKGKYRGDNISSAGQVSVNR